MSSGLIERFSTKQISVRLKRISIVATYSHLLAQLADPQEAQKAESTLTQLGQSIEALNTDVENLRGSDSTTSIGAGPVMNLYAFFKGAWRTWKGEKVVRDKVQKCGPLISPLIDDLIVDTQRVKWFYKNGMETRFGKYAKYYREHLCDKTTTDVKSSVLISPANIGGRAYFLDKAEQAASNFANPKIADPTQMLQLLKSTHDQLVLTASTTNNKSSLDNLSKKLTDYTNSISAFIADLKTLESARHYW